MMFLWRWWKAINQFWLNIFFGKEEEYEFQGSTDNPDLAKGGVVGRTEGDDKIPVILSPGYILTPKQIEVLEEHMDVDAFLRTLEHHRKRRYD